jgi:hypothetical protein
MKRSQPSRSMSRAFSLFQRGSVNPHDTFPLVTLALNLGAQKYRHSIRLYAQQLHLKPDTGQTYDWRLAIRNCDAFLAPWNLTQERIILRQQILNNVVTKCRIITNKNDNAIFQTSEEKKAEVTTSFTNNLELNATCAHLAVTDTV